MEKEITLYFDLDDEMQNRVYLFLKNMPEVYDEPNLSKAIILFINNTVSTIQECEQRTVRCEERLKVFKKIIEQEDS